MTGWEQLEALGPARVEELGPTQREAAEFLNLQLFLRRLEAGLGVWAHSGRTEQLSQAELQTTAAIAAGLAGGASSPAALS